MLAAAGIGFPLLFVVAITTALLSFLIQNADASGEYVSKPTSKSPNSAKNVRLAMNRIDTEKINDGYSLSSKILTDANSIHSFAANHYACPPTSVEALRRRYGTRGNMWGEWTCRDTRRFYRQQLPRALQIDGFLGLSLRERARLASEARHALRVYSRERCHLPGRLMARLLDGVRHLQTFGYWSSTGMTWEEIIFKYEMQIRQALGPDTSEELIQSYVYKKILDRACETNKDVDEKLFALEEEKERQISRITELCHENECDLQDDGINIPCRLFAEFVSDFSNEDDTQFAVYSTIAADIFDDGSKRTKIDKSYIVSRMQSLACQKASKESKSSSSDAMAPVSSMLRIDFDVLKLIYQLSTNNANTKDNNTNQAKSPSTAVMNNNNNNSNKKNNNNKSKNNNKSHTNRNTPPEDYFISYVGGAGSLVQAILSSTHMQLMGLDPTMLTNFLQLPFGV